jgi:deoxyadenosine/deoxycytidine kinase
MLDSRAPTERNAPVAEIIGVAGAGKSSLLNELHRRDSGLRVHFKLRKSSAAWPLLYSTVRSLPVLTELVKRACLKDRSEARQVARLEAIRRILTRERQRDDHPILLDEGPIYVLGRLQRATQSVPSGGAYAAWLAGSYDYWSSTISTVIWLDAPNDVLCERIRTRQKRHRMQRKGPDELRGFLELYRSAYEEVVASLELRGPVRALRIDSNRYTTREVADLVTESILDARLSV